jgi:hypothetical protein
VLYDSVRATRIVRCLSTALLTVFLRVRHPRYHISALSFPFEVDYYPLPLLTLKSPLTFSPSHPPPLGLCEGLESSFVILAESTRDTLLNLMLTCLQDSFPELRQSAFALTGDLSKNCVQFISPMAPQLIDIILRNLDFDYPMVCNNASWTVGELAIKVGGLAMAPYITRLMHSFIQILHEKDIPTTLTENVAITVGRLGVTNTIHLASYLSDYLEVWCM